MHGGGIVVFFQAEECIRDVAVTGLHLCLFFFSSRRRHTRCSRDWSSDVCSSDLDFYGPLKIYELLERHDSANRNFLVVGPWNHGGWSRSDGQKLGPIDFGSKTSEYYRKNVLARFLAYHLKGKGSLDLPEALTFRTGTNEWVRHDAWPPKRNVVARRLYFQANGKLSFDPPPASAPAFDTYVSDPANPVPYRPRPIDVRSGWTTWLVEDQRF